MKHLAPLAILLALPACTTVGQIAPAGWEIGPVIQGKNYSTGLPLAPDRHAEGWSIDIAPGMSPHYLTRGSPSLSGKTLMRLRFRTEGAPLVAANCPTATLFFQAAGETYSGRNGFRYWASFATATLGAPNSYEIVAPFSSDWTSVGTAQSALNAPKLFSAALSNAQRMGVTFGDCSGLGHGLRASAPGRIVITHFGVE